MDQEKRSKALKALEKRGLSLGGVGQAAKTLGGGAFKALPLIGNLWSAGSAAYNLAKGNFGSAALDAAGAIPGVGNYVNLGRAAYGLGQGSGAAQAQQPSPQGLPNYGKMAGLCPTTERTRRGLAFEAGVERFCKEAGFDDEDRVAVYNLLVKLAGPGDMGDISSTGGGSVDPNNIDLTNVDEKVNVRSPNPFAGRDQDPRLGVFERGYNFFNKATSNHPWLNAVPGGTTLGLGYDWLTNKAQNEFEASDRVHNQIEREKNYDPKNGDAYQARLVESAMGRRSEIDLDRRKRDAFAKADIMRRRDPTMSRGEAAERAFQGMGADARSYIRQYKVQGQPAGAAGGQAPAFGTPPTTQSGGSVPSMAALGRSAPPGASGGYQSGTPPMQPPAPPAGDAGMTIQKNPSFAGGGASSMGSKPGAEPMGPPAPDQGPPALKPNFKGNAASSMGTTPGANPMTPPPKAGGSIAPPKTPKV